jgi:hypothetical protein
VSLVLLVLVVAAISSIEGAAVRPPALPFIENDFEKALAGAQASKKPLFVEVWAPW